MALKEMKLMDLAKLVDGMKVGETIDFYNGNKENAETYCEWCGVKDIDEFDNDNPMYIISKWGGEAEAHLYHISEYDHQIGDFCATKLGFRKNATDQDWIDCCAYMITDYIQTYLCEPVSEVITVDCGNKTE